MFSDFARVWTPVAYGAELRSAPLAVTVAGEPVVIFRGPTGAPAALVDRCPHRSVALSLGKVKDGCIECPFHGWRLDASGAVCAVPWNPDAKLERLRGLALPVRELAGQIWIYTAPGAAPSEPEIKDVLLGERVRVSGFSVEWQTHWTRAMENMLDWPHLPFVHRATIGKSMAARVDRGARMDIDWEVRPWGTRSTIRIDGTPAPGALELRWPNQMNLHIPIEGKTLVMLVACVPIDPSRTRMMMTMARDFMTSRLFDYFFHRTNARIAAEDKAVLESSSPPVVPPPAEENSVRTDGPTLHFRKRYFAELHGSSSGARAGLELLRRPVGPGSEAQDGV